MTKRHRGDRALRRAERKREKRARLKARVKAHELPAVGGRVNPPDPRDRPFLNANLDLGYLTREFHVLRNHNKQFREGDAQDNMLMFSEGAVGLMTLERLLRLILGADRVYPTDTLYNLLERALQLEILDLPFGVTSADALELVTGLRNPILHANFEQAAQQMGCDVRTYFKRYFAPSLELIYQILDFFMRQLDPATGLPRDTPRRQIKARYRFMNVIQQRHLQRSWEEFRAARAERCRR